MIVEFLCRYQKDIKDESLKDIEEQLNIQEIIQGDRFDRDLEKQKLLGKDNLFEYGPVLFELDDIETANSIDKEHTCLKFYTGVVRILKISYDEYKMIYQTMTGQIINSFIGGIKEIDNG